jgi:DNA-directed RNA polymerase specialized sigma subunit
MTTITINSPMDEATLFRLDVVRERRNQRLRDQDLLRHLPHAYSLARQYAGAYGTEEELVKIATLGLVRAVHGYDRSTGVPFAAFAEPLIVAELEAYIEHDSPQSAGAREQAAAAAEADETIAEAIARQSHVQDLAGFLDCDVDALVGGLMLAVEREPHLIPGFAAREQTISAAGHGLR